MRINRHNITTTEGLHRIREPIDLMGEVCLPPFSVALYGRFMVSNQHVTGITQRFKDLRASHCPKNEFVCSHDPSTVVLLGSIKSAVNQRCSPQVHQATRAR
jgi:hypothetical protein